MSFQDCKKHYSDMYEVRLGSGSCPWCKLEIAIVALERISKSTECERHQGGGWTPTEDARIAKKALEDMK